VKKEKVRKLESVQNIAKKLSLKTPILEKIFNSKNVKLIDIDNNLSDLSYL
jgi:hypothetical protein